MYKSAASHFCSSSGSVRSIVPPGCMVGRGACIARRRRSLLVTSTPPPPLVHWGACTVKPLRPGASCAAAKSSGKGFGAPAVKSTTEELPADQPCPCGSGATYKACCSPFHSGAKLPDTAEQLLRSRYCSYFSKNAEYIADTTHPESGEFNGTRSTYLSAVRSTQRQMDCRSLEVIKTEPGRADAEVYITFKFTFVNRGTKNTDLKTRTEKSRFLKVAGQWLYMESDKFTET